MGPVEAYGRTSLEPFINSTAARRVALRYLLLMIAAKPAGEMRELALQLHGMAKSSKRQERKVTVQLPSLGFNAIALQHYYNTS